MTTIEKADEIGYGMADIANCPSFNTLYEYKNDVKSIAVIAAIRMAKWKDKCFSDVIKRLKETYQLDEQALFVLNLVESRYNAKK